MRFRAKFGVLGYVSTGSGAFFAILWITGRHPGTAGFFALSFFVLSLEPILNHFLVYWDIEADHLHERRLWRTTDIAWSEITHVGYWEKTFFLSVDHRRIPPMSDQGSIVANPEDQSGFINAVRRFAPQATIDV